MIEGGIKFCNNTTDASQVLFRLKQTLPILKRLTVLCILYMKDIFLYKCNSLVKYTYMD